MGVSLSKGGNVSLTKEAAQALTTITVGLGWDPQSRDGADFDLDASALIVDGNDKILSDAHFVFYNQLSSPSGDVKHSGDNLTGGGQGDDEQIVVNVAGLEAAADKVVFAVTIHEADSRKQNFGQVKNAFIRVVDDNDGKELARYDLTEDAAGETAMLFGQLYRKDSEIKFKAIGQGYSAGLRGVATEYGVSVA